MPRNNDVKDFHDLIKEVRARGICGQCGGCVSFCSAGELNALRFDKKGAPEFANKERCLKCGICYLVCPQAKVLDEDLKKRHNWRKPIGSSRSLQSAATTHPKVARVATDGGVVTSLLLYALERKMIDGAVVSKRTNPFTCVPDVATTAQQVMDAAGSHFDHISNLGAMGGSYSSFVPAIREIGELHHRGLSRVAFVGTPCQVYSLRKMQALRVVPSDAIAMVIGLFCMENFTFNKAMRRKLEKKIGIKLDNVAKLNLKEDVILTVGAGATVHVPFELLEEFARPACLACTDFSNEFADISCGGLGSPDGYTTVMVRSVEGERLYNAAARAGFIKELKFEAKQEAQLHSAALIAKTISFSERKRQRAASVLGRKHA